MAGGYWRTDGNSSPFGLRIIGWLSYGLLRLMMGISGYALEKPKGGDSALERHG